MSERIYESTLDSPIGPVEILSTRHGLAAVELGKGSRRKLEKWARRIFPGGERSAAGKLHRIFEDQLREYFEGRRKVFDLTLDLRGSKFQKAVWAEVARIPFGLTATYGEVAHLVGRPRASRAVGAANGANPIPIIIPCHRVIGANGSLTGYGGGLENKRWLLAHEGVLRAEACQMRLFRSRDDNPPA